MPIETASKLKVVSRALMALGEKAATALSDDRYGVQVGAELFEQLFQNELAATTWRFAVKKKQLSRLVDEPLNEWTYAFQLPTDMVMPHKVYPRTRYEVFADKLYADVDTVELDYIFVSNVAQVPAYFFQLLVDRMAMELALPVTSSLDKYKVAEARYKAQLARAMFADAQGRPNTPVQDSPFTDVR